ncbi:MAG: hypothetical protein RLT87_10505 [Gammaproteobacteria bacterium]
MRILILYAINATSTGTTNDHIEAFKNYSKNDIFLADYRVAEKLIDFSIYDCLVIHHSIPIGYQNSIGAQLEKKIIEYDGLKVLFIQDEMRWVNSTCDKIKKYEIAVIFTVTQSSVTRKIYRESWFDQIIFENVLTGYVPTNLLSLDVPEYFTRKYDVTYRARKLPAWCGYFGQEKSIIADRFSQDARAYNLNCNISCAEKDRVYGRKWIKLMANSKSVLGAESGSSFIDFAGDIAPAIDAYQSSNPLADFKDIKEKYLLEQDGEIIIKAISPRCFEAAALKTLMIMYEGEYSGVLTAGRHYVPLRRDHKNMNDVVKILRDVNEATAIINNAYNEIACNDEWSYKSFIRRFDAVISDAFARKGLVAKANAVESAQSIQESIVDINKIYYKHARKQFIKYKLAVGLSKCKGVYFYILENYMPVYISGKLHRVIAVTTRPFRNGLRNMLLK